MQKVELETQHEGTNLKSVLIDAHVHFYDCYDQVAFFKAACSNFQAAVREVGLDPTTPGCLFLAETTDDHYFRKFRESTDGPSPKTWQFQRTAEDHSLIAFREGGGRLILVAGRQIATTDGLEVLALGTDISFPRELNLVQALSAINDCAAIAVIPYGFGKWWFRRGRLLKELLETTEPVSFFLGDNSGRWRFARRPALFARAESRGILTLPGSDPLPFLEQERKVGSYGFVLPGQLDEQRPAQSLMKHIQGMTTSPQCFGRLETLTRFCRYQLAMRLRKRRQKVLQ